MADARDEDEAAEAQAYADDDGGGVATLAPEADAEPARRGPPERLDLLDEKVNRQGGWTSLLWTVLIVVAAAAFLYACAYYFSIERIIPKAEAVAVTTVPEEDGEEEGKKGTAYDVGDVDAEMQNQEVEQPSDAPPPDLVADMLQVISQTDFADPDRTGNTGGGTEGGAGGLGEKGKGVGKGGKRRAERWQVEYGNGAKDQYARILDFFKIKIAAFRNGRCQAAEGFGRGATVVKHAVPPAKLFFQPQDIARQRTDRDFLKDVGIAVGDQDIVCQYYPPELEARLLQLELAFAKRQENEIANTRFGIRPAGDNQFELYVVEQNPL